MVSQLQRIHTVAQGSQMILKVTHSLIEFVHKLHVIHFNQIKA